MYLSRIELYQFKNYTHTSLDFAPKLNILVGDNGMGKTNILDAIHYLCVCKSHFQASDRWAIQEAKDFFRIEGWFKTEQTEQISCKYSPRTKKVISHEQVPYAKLSEHIGKYPIVFIAPDDTELLTESGEGRRQFMDFTLSQSNPQYLQALVQYNRVLEQRNSLLKTPSPDLSILGIYAQQLAPHAAYIHAQRKVFFETFEPIFQSYYTQIAGKEELVGLQYKSKLSEGALLDIWQHALERDLYLQRTTEGCHRDDLICTLRGQPVKQTASQGQRKSYLLALKLAQYALLHTALGIQPILLLDDIFDKLDSSRVAHLISILGEAPFGQVFISDTAPKRLGEILDTCGQTYAIFRVKNGEVLV
jgi:DNA replication and repair protein RecF